MKRDVMDQYRQCTVKGKNGLFHGWFPSGKVFGIVAIVEFEDGFVSMVDPTIVKFEDGSPLFYERVWNNSDNNGVLEKATVSYDLYPIERQRRMFQKIEEGENVEASKTDDEEIVVLRKGQTVSVMSPEKTEVQAHITGIDISASPDFGTMETLISIRLSGTLKKREFVFSEGGVKHELKL